MNALENIQPGEVFLLPGGRYQEDEANASALLKQTCLEQHGRLHTLFLLDQYLARTHSARKHRLIAQEKRSLADLYEAVWSELRLAFPQNVVDSVRQLIETSVATPGRAA
jgi:hypothetical protein